MKSPISQVSDCEMRKSRSFLMSESGIHRKLTSPQVINNYMFVPCINCNNLINIEEIGKTLYKLHVFYSNFLNNLFSSILNIIIY